MDAGLTVFLLQLLFQLGYFAGNHHEAILHAVRHPIQAIKGEAPPAVQEVRYIILPVQSGVPEPAPLLVPPALPRIDDNDLRMNNGMMFTPTSELK